MKLLIAGSRNIPLSLPQLDSWILAIPTKVTEVVSGGAKGVDLVGEAWAKTKGVPVRQFLPDWSLGKKAGPIRNKLMVDYADGALIVWDGESRGTKSTIDYLEKSEKKYVLKISPTPAQRNEKSLIIAADNLAAVALEWHRTKTQNERHMACSLENPCDLWIALQVYKAQKG
jgi:predicted Rossmann fold nucleotide-binding protein DprA/Smf involved in DNA uptake